MPIKWDSSHSVNVKELDDQHHNFISQLNELYRFIYEGKSHSELEAYLDELIKYAELHFATEEKYFDKFNYENAVAHKAEHAKLKSKISDLKKKLNTGEEDITLSLVDFMEDWLVDHLDSQDKKYTQCFNEHGLY